MPTNLRTSITNQKRHILDFVEFITMPENRLEAAKRLDPKTFNLLLDLYSQLTQTLYNIDTEWMKQELGRLIPTPQQQPCRPPEANHD